MPRAQVMVEAAIVEVSGDITDALGVQWAVDARGGTGGVGGVSFGNTGLSIGSVLNAISSFGEDSFGEIYIVSKDGPIYRIEPAGGIVDCNANNIDDACEIAFGLVEDVNANGIPDECGPCPGDANGDRIVSFGDITSVLSNWLVDYTPTTGPGDANGDGLVTFEDITEVLSNWLIPCP